jgi:hypothetical protein
MKTLTSNKITTELIQYELDNYKKIEKNIEHSSNIYKMYVRQKIQNLEQDLHLCRTN